LGSPLTVNKMNKYEMEMADLFATMSNSERSQVENWLSASIRREFWTLGFKGKELYLVGRDFGGQIFVPERTFRVAVAAVRTLERNKELFEKLAREERETTLQRGNMSLTLDVPSKAKEKFNIEKGDDIEVSITDEGWLIKPKKGKKDEGNEDMG